MKRVLIVAAAVAVLAGCTSPAPNAYDLAHRIPGWRTSASQVEITVQPAPADIAIVQGHDGVDIVATFSTNTARTKWAQAVAGDSVNTERVDGNRWTMITTDKAGYRADAPRSRDIVNAAVALRGTVVPIRSK